MKIKRSVVLFIWSFLRQANPSAGQRPAGPIRCVGRRPVGAAAQRGAIASILPRDERV
jgi:hypothetical protein